MKKAKQHIILASIFIIIAVGINTQKAKAAWFTFEIPDVLNIVNNLSGNTNNPALPSSNTTSSTSEPSSMCPAVVTSAVWQNLGTTDDTVIFSGTNGEMINNCPSGYTPTGLGDDNDNEISLTEDNFKGGDRKQLCIKTDNPEIKIVSTWVVNQSCPANMVEAGVYDNYIECSKANDPKSKWYNKKHWLDEEDGGGSQCGSELRNSQKLCIGVQSPEDKYQVQITKRQATGKSAAAASACQADEAFLVESTGGTAMPGSDDGQWNVNQEDYSGQKPNALCMKVTPKEGAICKEILPGDNLCGSSNGKATASIPTSGLCLNAATSSQVTDSGDQFTWSCQAETATFSCAAEKTPNNNSAPNKPLISGDTQVKINTPSANFIVATDPENDDVFYELDWDNNGSVDGITTTQSSGQSTAIGHTYTSLGTKVFKGRAVQANNTDKKSEWVTYNIEVVNEISANQPPAIPTISGHTFAVVNQTTSNNIVATDPENDDVFYEIDWNGSGSIDGVTSPATASGISVPIGHTYSSVGTYTLRARTVQANDPSKKSGFATYTITVVNGGGSCTLQANACGLTNGSVVNGSCVAPGLPAGYGDACSGPANACGMTTGGGTIGCDGSCSVTSIPSNTLCSCTTAANICGMTSSGRLNAAGTSCVGTVPPNTSCPCTSPQNACGMTNTGNFDLSGTSCSASAPSDSLCPAAGVGTTINEFRASPKLLAVGKTSKLYWDISGNRSGCTISYSKTPGGSSISVLSALNSNAGQIVTTPVTEKRYYYLTCGAVQKEAIVSTYSLTEI